MGLGVLERSLSPRECPKTYMPLNGRISWEVTCNSELITAYFALPAYLSGKRALKSEQSRGQDLSQKLTEAQEALQAAKRAHREAVDGMQLDFQESERLIRYVIRVAKGRVEHKLKSRRLRRRLLEGTNSDDLRPCLPPTMVQGGSRK